MALGKIPFEHLPIGGDTEEPHRDEPCDGPTSEGPDDTPLSHDLPERRQGSV